MCSSVSGSAAWLCRGQWRVADQDRVPQQPVDLVDQQVQVSGNRCAARSAAHLPCGCRLRRVELLGCRRRDGQPTRHGRRWDAAAQPRRDPRGPTRPCPRPAACPVSAARDSASAARDCVPVTASSRSCRATAACSRAARASSSATAIASRASASRASACRAAQRACHVSASACSARARSPARASSPAVICASSPARSSACSRALWRACATCSAARWTRPPPAPALRSPARPRRPWDSASACCAPRPLFGALSRPRFGLGLPRLGLLGAGPKPGPGLLARLDLRFQPGPQLGLLPRGVLMGLRHLPRACATCSAAADSAASRARAAPCPASPARDSASAARDSASAARDSASAARDSASPPGTAPRSPPRPAPAAPRPPAPARPAPSARRR